MMNYCDPFQNVCPNPVGYILTLNQHLAADVAQFNEPVADVFMDFGGAATPNPNIYNCTWMCNSSKNVHTTSTGYGVIANTFKATVGY